MIQEKSPCPERARTLLRGTTLHLYSAKGRTGNQKAPVHSGTGARSRYHPALYFNGYSVTGTSVLAYYLRLGSSRVIDHGYVAPVFTIHRLSEAPNFRFPLVHSMCYFNLTASITDTRRFVKWKFFERMRISYCDLSISGLSEKWRKGRTIHIAPQSPSLHKTACSSFL